MDIFSLVIEDLRSRDAIGYKQHRRPLTEDTRTLLQWLQESYEERLDDVVYMKGAIKRLEKVQALIDEIAQYAAKKGGAWRTGEGTEIMDALDALITPEEVSKQS